MIDKEIIESQTNFLLNCIGQKKLKDSVNDIILDIFHVKYTISLKYGYLNKTKAFINLDDDNKEFTIIISENEINKEYWILMSMASILLGHIHKDNLSNVFKHNHHEDLFFKECIFFRDIFNNKRNS